jgi:hypothetical protein
MQSNAPTITTMSLIGESFVGESFVGESFVGESFVGVSFVGVSFVGKSLIGERSAASTAIIGAKPAQNAAPTCAKTL